MKMGENLKDDFMIVPSKEVMNRYIAFRRWKSVYSFLFATFVCVIAWYFFFGWAIYEFPSDSWVIVKYQKFAPWALWAGPVVLYVSQIVDVKKALGHPDFWDHG